MKLKEYFRSIGSTLTISVVARLEGYKSDVALHKMYERGQLDKLKKMVLDAEKRFVSICK